MWRLSLLVFFSSFVFLLLAFIILKDSYAAILPISVLYFLAAFMLFILNFVSYNILGWNIRYIFIANALLSILSLPFFLAWFADNSLSYSFTGVFYDRKDKFAMSDPYILACATIYILILSNNKYLKLK